MDETPILASSLKRADVGWGDEFRAAYAQAKRHFPNGTITYSKLAERVSRLVPVSHTSILRLGQLEELPDAPSTRQIAYLSLVAMGFDPTEFGLERTDRALRGMTEADVRRYLDPGIEESNGVGAA